MFKKTFTILALAFILSILTLALLYDRGLDLSLSAKKPQLIRWEPIPIALSLKNRSLIPAHIKASLGFNLGMLKLFVIEQDGSRKRIEPLSRMAASVNIPEEYLMPGEKMESSEVLDLTLDTFFDRVGTYNLQASLEITPGKQIWSNVASLEVLAPTEPIEEQAMEFMRQHMGPAFLFGGGTLNDLAEARNVLEQFVEQYQDTPYWPYAAYILSIKFTMDNDNIKAVQLLERLAKGEWFAMHEHALYNLIFAYASEGRAREAAAELQRLRQQYPSSDYSDEASEYVERAKQNLPL